MRKVRAFGLVLAAAAGVMMTGAGLASAGAEKDVDPTSSTAVVVAGENPDTGSSKALTEFIKALSAGSSSTKPAPTP